MAYQANISRGTAKAHEAVAHDTAGRLREAEQAYTVRAITTELDKMDLLLADGPRIISTRARVT